MNRLYAIETTPTLTGARADHRLVLRASEIEGFARALAGAVGTGGGAAGQSLANADAQKWVASIAKDLQAHRGRSLVMAGDYQPAALHTLAREMNQALGNVGTTITYAPSVEVNATEQLASFRELVQAMDAGQVDMLVIMGGNPVFTAPVDFKFQERLAKVGLSVHHSLFFDETSAYCHWNVPEAHAFESWSDARSFDGTVTIMQPLIAPLYDGRTQHELLSAFIEAQSGKSAARSGEGLLDARARRQSRRLDHHRCERPGISDAGWLLEARAPRRVCNGQRQPRTEWRGARSEGRRTSGERRRARSGACSSCSRGGQAATSATEGATTPAPSPIAPRQSPPASEASPSGGLEIIFRPDPTVWDGRFANNGWLQELPKPFTKITWDPAAWISARTAQEKGLNDADLIELRYRGNTAKLPVAIVPGHPDNSVTVFFGYGRQRIGRVGKPADDQANEFNVFGLRTSDAPWFGSGLEIAKAGRYVLARTQEHHLMEGRAPVRAGTLKEYSDNPKFVAEMGETPPRALSLIPDWEYNSYRWGMAIDLTTCTGCSTCTIACVAENNIPVVGKDQVNRGREMHWIRVDHYFAGNPEEPNSIETYHQPIPCMQCENAPCELVCPVGATTHSAEGLNDMVYNRCVGTRYCSNNCPYKVRRFNFLLYSDWNTESLYPLRNPDVTVRSRGVMEKCTYCVQRINYARIEAKKQDRKIQDGEIIPACAQACPADAIVFGDIGDPNSAVSKLKAQQRNYGLLEDLNTRPRTTYLAALRNPNPELETSGGAASRTEH